MLKYGFKASRRLIYGFYCLRHEFIARISKIPVWSCQKLIQGVFGLKDFGLKDIQIMREKEEENFEQKYPLCSNLFSYQKNS